MNLAATQPSTHRQRRWNGGASRERVERHGLARLPPQRRRHGLWRLLARLQSGRLQRRPFRLLDAAATTIDPADAQCRPTALRSGIHRLLRSRLEVVAVRRHDRRSTSRRFYQQIHDYQLNTFNGFNFITRNVPEVISQGVELEIATRPMDGLHTQWRRHLQRRLLRQHGDVQRPRLRFRTRSRSGDPLSFAPEWVGDCAHRVRSAARRRTCTRSSIWMAAGTANIGRKR